MSWGAARRLFHASGHRDPQPEQVATAVPEPRPLGSPRVAASLCVASGKGGTGKSVFTASIASALARHGRTLIVDADMGIGNAHILQGAAPARSFVEVITGGYTVAEVVTACGPRLDLVAAGSGVSRMAALSTPDLARIANGLAQLEPDYDYVLTDSAAGVSNQTIAFAAASDQVLLVTTPDVTAMTDAYAFLKVLLRVRAEVTPLLVVNRAHHEDEARCVAARMESVSRKFLGRAARFVGWVPEDESVQAAVNARAPVIRHAPSSPAGCALQELGALVARDLGSQSPRGLGRSLSEAAGS